MIPRTSTAPRPPAARAAGLAFTACLTSVLGALAARAQEPAAGAAADAAALVNPVPYTDDAIARGRKHYLRLCQSCHGYDGKALENIDYEAADLTNPDLWRFGATDGDVFRTTKDGAGQDMPPFGAKLEDREIWELVSYLRRIGPEKLRPKPSDAGTSQATEPPGRL